MLSVSVADERLVSGKPTNLERTLLGVTGQFTAHPQERPLLRCRHPKAARRPNGSTTLHLSRLKHGFDSRRGHQ
jgi:hypothetical protein